MCDGIFSLVSLANQRGQRAHVTDPALRLESGGADGCLKKKLSLPLGGPVLVVQRAARYARPLHSSRSR